MENPRTLYDDNAASWVRTQPLSLSDFTGRPPVLALCQPVDGLRVLDLGCGEGYCARQLRQMGAREVVGIDVSAGMIAAAQAQEAAAQDQGGVIRYHQGDATQLTAHAPASFDLVLSMFMFNYLTLQDTGRCMAEVARVLRPGGRFVFAAPHPLLPFLRPAEPPFYFAVGGAGYFSARDSRFPGKIWKRDGSALEVQLVHKTLEDYFSALREAGFSSLPIVRELHVTPQIRLVDPAFFAPLGEVPLHLAFSLTR